jgi:hypothetical protein
MNYMQDPPQADIFAELTHWLATPVVRHSCAKWLLFDGAVLGEQVTKRLVKMSKATEIHHLFADTEFSAYGRSVPHLIPLDQGNRGEGTLRTVLEYGGNLPAIAILDACADAGEVCNTLRWLARAKTVDGLDMYCRFADTRITSVLMDVLCPHQLATLGMCIENWRILDRHGRLRQVLPSLASVTGSGWCDLTDHTIEKLVFSDKQYLSMMRLCEADEIFFMLSEGAPDLVPDGHLGDFHNRLSNLLFAARQHGLDKTSEIFQFSVIALTTRDSFFLDPILEEFWGEIRHKGCSFSSLVQAWTDQTWEALTRPDSSEATPVFTAGGNR